MNDIEWYDKDKFSDEEKKTIQKLKNLGYVITKESIPNGYLYRCYRCGRDQGKRGICMRCKDVISDSKDFP